MSFVIKGTKLLNTYNYYLKSFVPRCFSYELPFPVLGEAGARGDHGDVVGADNIQVESPEACLLFARQLKLVKN